MSAVIASGAKQSTYPLAALWIASSQELLAMTGGEGCAYLPPPLYELQSFQLVFFKLPKSVPSGLRICRS